MSPSADFSVWPFVAGGLAGCFSATVMAPVDLVKVRLQAKTGEAGSLSVVKDIYRKENGVRGFYRGISAVWLRQIIYKGAVLGLYDVFSEGLKESMPSGQVLAQSGQIRHSGHLSPIAAAVAAASAAGCASIIGNPTDRALVLMQTDRMLPVAERKNYKHAFHALTSVMQKEGLVRGCFTGVQATTVRAVSLNIGFLGGNTVTKQFLGSSEVVDQILHRYDGHQPRDCNSIIPTAGKTIDNSSHFIVVAMSAVVAAVLSCVTSLPADFVRVQLMAGLYRSPWQCCVATLRNRGPFGFYTGFGTYFAKQAPMSALTLLFQDGIKKLLPE